MLDEIRETGTLEIMPKDQIRQNLREQMQKMENFIESMVLTWGKTETEYIIEIVFHCGAKDVCECSEACEKTTYHLIVGKINAFVPNPTRRLFVEGRRLYFCLRKEFPMLQRKLCLYKSFRHK